MTFTQTCPAFNVGLSFMKTITVNEVKNLSVLAKSIKNDLMEAGAFLIPLSNNGFEVCVANKDGEALTVLRYKDGWFLDYDENIVSVNIIREVLAPETSNYKGKTYNINPKNYQGLYTCYDGERFVSADTIEGIKQLVKSNVK